MRFVWSKEGAEGERAGESASLMLMKLAHTERISKVLRRAT